MDRNIGEEQQDVAGYELEGEVVTFARYLSDEVPPMLVAEAIGRLMAAPKVVAATIQTWVGNQYSGPNPLPVQDYLFHAVKKLHLLAEFELVDKEQLQPLLVSLYPILLEFCPESDRVDLAKSLQAIGHEKSLLSSPVEVVHRPTGSGAERRSAVARAENKPASSASGARAGSSGVASGQPEDTSRLADGLERLNLLLDRFELPAAGPAGSGRGADKTQTLLTEIVGELTASSKSEMQFRSQLELLGTLGIKSSGFELLQLLSRSLPDWVEPMGGENVPAPVKTMQRVVGLASTSGETRKRFFEFVDVAVKEFNSGALGRAATLLRSAEQMVVRNEVDGSIARNVKGQIYSRLDQEILRRELESEHNYRALRHVLAFFPQVSVEELLLELEVEQKRDRRRFLFSLLRAHGPPARLAALDGLTRSMSGRRRLSWYVERNLISLLRTVSRAEGEEVTATEVEVIAHYSELAGELPVVREAARLLGATPGPRAEAISIARVGETEQTLLGLRESQHDAEELQGLLDQLVRDLGKRTTPAAWRCVVGHALKRKPALGDTTRRIVELGRHNLADEPEVLDPILDSLGNELPLKVFNVTVAGKRRIMNVKRLIAALAGTDSSAVRQLLSEIANQFRGQELAIAAERALDRVVSDDGPSGLDEERPTLAGDIGLFGLPNLLQNLADSKLTGELTVQSQTEDGTATVRLVEGRLNGATYGRLEDQRALYQLLQRPMEGHFVFTTRKVEEVENSMDLVSLLLEGMRRYDELARDEALVPDETRLEPTGLKPSLPSPEIDRDLAKSVWEKARQGVAALECEQVANVDSFEVRTLLAHWVSQGALKPVSSAD